VPVAKTLVGPNASKEAFDKLVDSMTRLHKESYIKSIEATVMSDNQSRLGEIRVPTHVIVGGEDKLTTPEMARGLVDKIPNAKLTVIADAGHLVNIEKPVEFNDAAIAFIRSPG
jgi:3-oxoadipate enol-lactonase